MRPTWPIARLLLPCTLAAGLLLAVSAQDTQSPPLCCGVITPQGEHLLQTIDGMDVEHLWQSHFHVDWETGEKTTGEYLDGRTHTHCSQFAAAVGQRLGIYMLHPPDHSPDLLASAQGEWFGSKAGQAKGWYAVKSSREAQTLANQGALVVLVYINPHPDISGHIVVVRPEDRSEEALNRDGPATAQAGKENFSKGNARRSFETHKGAWPSKILMFAHALPA